jgi:uncharacterized protein YdaU (DUF1376 family)
VKAPWFKLWAPEFLSDNFVDAMTAEQIGWYCILLIRSWNHTPKGYLPNDEHLLAGWCKCAEAMTFKQRAKLVLDRFETTEDGRFIYHPKLIEQVSKLNQTSENRALAGQKGGKKSAEQKRSKRQAIATHLPTELELEVEQDKSSSEDAWFVARGVAVKLRIVGQDIISVLHDQAEFELKDGDTPENIGDRMVDSWRAYDKVKAEAKFGVKNFFASGEWRKHKPTPVTPRKTASQRMAEVN